MELIHTIRKNFFLYLAFDARASHDSLELHAQFIGEFATLGKEFIRYFLYLSLIYFAIYEYVVHVYYFLRGTGEEE